MTDPTGRPTSPRRDVGASPVTEVLTAATGTSVRRMRKLRVTIVDAPAAAERGRVHTFAQDEIRVGSSPDADVPITDAAVSREHASIRVGAHGWTITDHGSTNGTFV